MAIGMPLDPVTSNSTTGIHYIHGNQHIAIMKSNTAGLREFRRHQVMYRTQARFRRDARTYTTVICDKRDNTGKSEDDDHMYDDYEPGAKA